MQRFLYTPKVEAYVMLEYKQQIVNLTGDIISGEVDRNLDAMSTASLVLQNKNGQYLSSDKAEEGKIRIMPMDRIVILASRIGVPQLIFSGYVDEAPYFQLYPGPVTLRCSDSLKLLQNTFFDPGLPAMYNIFSKYGFMYNPATGNVFDPQATFGNFDINGGIADVAMDALNTIGGWPIEGIDIRSFPKGFRDKMHEYMVANLKEEEQQLTGLKDLLSKLFEVTTTDSSSSSSTSTDSTQAAVHGNISAEEVAKLALDVGLNHSQAIIAVAIAAAESNFKSDAVNYNPPTPRSAESWDYGLWQINTYYHQPKGMSRDAFKALMFSPTNNAKYMDTISNHGTDWTPWATYNSRAYEQYIKEATTAVDKALKNPSSGLSSQPQNQTSQAAQGLKPTDRKQPTTTVADRVVSIAIDEAKKGISGNLSSPEIRKYQEVTGAIGQNWCGSFVAWVFKQAQRPLSEIPGWPSAGAAVVSYYTAGGSQRGWSRPASPQPGDIVTYGTDMHVGIVTSVGKGGNFNMVSGNWGNGVRFQAENIHNPLNPSGATPGRIVFVRPSGMGTFTGTSDATGATGGGAGGGAGSAGMTDERVAQIARQSAFFSTQISQTNMAESILLSGKRALANDVNLLDWIGNIILTSGRRFCTKANGEFLAFFPDYFLQFEGTPYFMIRDIEIIDLTMQRNDQSLVTHVFTVGPVLNPQGGISLWDEAISQVASVEEPAFNYFINIAPDDPSTPAIEGFDANQFLRKFGARPYKQDIPEVNDRTLLWMAGWNKFRELWSKQFITNASFTFMPELFPGGVISLGNRVSMFVESVTHSFDYETGFTTTAQLTSPSSASGVFPDLSTSGIGVGDPSTAQATTVSHGVTQ